MMNDILREVMVDLNVEDDLEDISTDPLNVELLLESANELKSLTSDLENLSDKEYKLNHIQNIINGDGINKVLAASLDTISENEFLTDENVLDSYTTDMSSVNADVALDGISNFLKTTIKKILKLIKDISKAISNFIKRSIDFMVSTILGTLNLGSSEEVSVKETVEKSISDVKSNVVKFKLIPIVDVDKIDKIEKELVSKLEELFKNPIFNYSEIITTIHSVYNNHLPPMAIEGLSMASGEVMGDEFKNVLNLRSDFLRSNNKEFHELMLLNEGIGNSKEVLETIKLHYDIIGEMNTNIVKLYAQVFSTGQNLGTPEKVSAALDVMEATYLLSNISTLSNTLTSLYLHISEAGLITPKPYNDGTLGSIKDSSVTLVDGVWWTPVVTIDGEVGPDSSIAYPHPYLTPMKDVIKGGVAPDGILKAGLNRSDMDVIMKEAKQIQKESKPILDGLKVLRSGIESSYETVLESVLKSEGKRKIDDPDDYYASVFPSNANGGNIGEDTRSSSKSSLRRDEVFSFNKLLGSQIMNSYNKSVTNISGSLNDLVKVVGEVSKFNKDLSLLNLEAKGSIERYLLLMSTKLIKKPIKH